MKIIRLFCYGVTSVVLYKTYEAYAYQRDRKDTPTKEANTSTDQVDTVVAKSQNNKERTE